MNWIAKIPRLYRRIHGVVWRRLISKPASWLLKGCWGLNLTSEMTLVGWPIFKGEGQVVIGKGCVLISSQLGNPIGLFRPCIIESIYPSSKIEIGHGFSASGVCIVAETAVRIGDNVGVGANATIIDTDFHSIGMGLERDDQRPKSKPIKIEDGVWIGMNAVILKGVTLHRGAVVGANAVVTKDVPAGAIAVGNPARIILTDHAKVALACS